MNTKQILTFLALTVVVGSSFYAYGMEEHNKKLSSDEADQVFILYVKYFQKAKNQAVRDSAKLDLSELIDNYKTLQALKVDYSIDDIKKNYEKYGIIILRNPATSKKLLLGAGNSPVIPRPMGEHTHEGYVTINPELSMNPTIVGAFGVDEGLNRFLKDSNHTFNVLAAEGVTIGVSAEEWLKNPVSSEALKMLDEGFKNYEINDKNEIEENFGSGIEGLKDSNLFWEQVGN